MTSSARIPQSEESVLRADALDTEFVISVAHPIGASRDEWRVSAPAAGLPVVYVLDGNSAFGTAAESVRTMQSAGELPPFLTVAIGYRGDAFPKGFYELRMRDFTPTADGDAPSGRGGEMLAFLETQVKPFIESRYGVDSTDATLAGYSLGGLFAAYAMLCRPGLFQRFIIGSPSVWWDGEVILQHEEAYAANHADLAARVFLSVGELEPPRMLSGMRTLAQRLRAHNYRSLTVSEKIMEGETHASGKATAFVRGVRSIFAT